MRKIISLFLSVLMLLSLCNVCFATEPQEMAGKTVIPQSNDDHGDLLFFQQLFIAFA